MPRRRMLDPSFWEDSEVATLTRDERLFLLGCINNADDEGRLKGHPAYLKAAIFMYDEDITTDQVREIKYSVLQKMDSWPDSNSWLMLNYKTSTMDHLYFPNWFDYQKPSHPTPSKLPPPPEKFERNSGVTPEELPKSSRNAPEELRPRLGEGRGRLGKVNPPSEERKRVSPEKDPRVKEILDTISQKVGYQIPNYAKEGAAVKRALKMGFSPEQFITCWEKMKTFEFWRGKWLPLSKVTENIGEFVAGRLEERRSDGREKDAWARAPGRHPPRAERKPLQPIESGPDEALPEGDKDGGTNLPDMQQDI